MRWVPKLRIVELTEVESAQVESIAAEALGNGLTRDLEEVVDTIALMGHSLPLRLRDALYDFKLRQQAHAICLRGRKPEDDIIGQTPESHRAAGNRERVHRYDVMHLMYASLLGESFAWTSIQSGYVFNDIIPVREHADLPASSGYTSNFGLHTEDAFHPWAGDYLGLACLRNPDRVSTTLAGFDTDQLSASTRNTLFQPRFIVGANIAQRVDQVTIPSPVLFGDPDIPYMRINLNATTAADGDSEARAALDEFVGILTSNVTSVAFQPGDFWYIDNLRVAHGREQFHPRFDGRDRWLRRLYISSAFRYTRGLREGASSRILDPTRRQWSTFL